jgi:rubrerythrin
MANNPALEALDTALDVERTGYGFYMSAAQTTESPEGKLMFTNLARDEMKHFGWLAEQRMALEETGAFGALEEPERPAGNPVFPTGPEQKPGRPANTHELEALRRGIQAELDSIALYGRLLGETSDSNGQDMYRRLIDMEQGHLMILRAEEDYLTRTGFYFGDFEYDLEAPE